MDFDFIEKLKNDNCAQRGVWYINTFRTPDGCLMSTNKTNHDGYLRVRCNKKSRLRMAHIIAWEHTNGEIPEGMEVNHKCSNRACFNPDHLELMDGSEHATHTNINRVGYTMIRKSDEEIINFYYQVKYENVAINEIVRKYDIKRSTLSSIMNKRSRVNITNWVDDWVEMRDNMI